MWLILIAAILVISKLVNLWDNRRLIKLSWELKSDSISLPFVGHVYKFFGTDVDIMNALHCVGRQALNHNGLTSWWIGALNVCVADPVVADCVLKKFLEKGSNFKQVLKLVVGNANIIAPVNIWRARRKILSPNFNSKRLNQFVDVFAEQSNIMVQQLKAKTNAGPFSIWNFLTTYTLDSTFELLVGQKLHSQKNHDHPVVRNFKTGSELMAKRMFSPWQYNDTIYKILPAYSALKTVKEFADNYIDDMITPVRKFMKQRNETKPNEENCKPIDDTRMKTVVELLINNSGGDRGYSDQELREEVYIVGLAALDTSAVGSGFALVMLARHPDVQQKVYEELNEVFGDSKRPITHEDLPRLQYLDAVIKETLRLYPPGPLVVRKCDEDFTLESGVTLVKGCQILVNIWAIHRNPKYWGDDAEVFRPERFLDTPLKHPAQFMPFSYGPRNCIGSRYAMLSIKSSLSTILRNYLVLPGTPVKPGGEHPPLQLKYSIMMKDVDGYMIQLQQRERDPATMGTS